MTDWIQKAAEEIAEYVQALLLDQALGGVRTMRWEGPATSHIVAAIIQRHATAPEKEPGERIVASAIREGRNVFTAAHHHTIIRYVSRCAGISPVKGEQGFVTDSGRFVGRKEALGIAVAAGQIANLFSTAGGLLSEMLWIVPDVDPDPMVAREAEATEPTPGGKQ